MNEIVVRIVYEIAPKTVVLDCLMQFGYISWQTQIPKAPKSQQRKKSPRNYKITKKIERKEKASRKKSPINGLVVLFIKIKFTVIT